MPASKTVEPPTAEELRQWMEDHGYTTLPFALELGIEPSTVRKWLSGTHGTKRWLAWTLRGLGRRGRRGGM